MRYVSRRLEKSELNNQLLARCESRGREVYSAGGKYLGLAETVERAELWSASSCLLKMAKRAAEGTAPTREEWIAIVERILKTP